MWEKPDRIDIEESGSVYAVWVNMVLFKQFSIAQTTHLLIKTYNIISNIL